MGKRTTQPNDAVSSAPVAIVAIGSAAGGLDALEKFFAAFPTELGIALVIVQHLNTDGSDVLVNLVSDMSPLPIVKLTDKPVQLESNRVYAAPQRCLTELTDRGLVAIESADPGKRAAIIDDLFQSLASRAESPVVGVVFSGKGNDGTLGLKAISDSGGMTIAQTAESAEQDEMPRSAASAGQVDHLLSPSEIPALLAEYVDHLAKTQRQANEQARNEEIEAVLPRICDALLEATDHDFRRYKTNTLVRRVVRRMQVLRLSRAEDYLHLMQDEREEAHTLFRDLLISVTAFFRDPDTFVALANHVIPKLIDNAKEGHPIRVWVAGCATGEEAYTLAMLLREGLDDYDGEVSDLEIQVFGTDIDQRALNVARAGNYPLSMADQLTERRLNRFFKKTKDHYQIVKEIRDMCVFSAHNLISDPPFSQLDLISCRNLLIYLGQPLQLKLIPLFHYALRPNGYLLLGSSESLTAHTEIFSPLDQQHRISQRKAGPASAAALQASKRNLQNLSATRSPNPSNDVDIHQISQRIVLDEFAPRYAVVNEEANLVCTSTGLDRYFEFTEGAFQNNAIKMAKPGLRSGIRSSLRESQDSLRTVVRDNLTLKTEDGVQRMELVVQPMPEIGEQSQLFMLVFRELGVARPRAEGEETPNTLDTESTIADLEKELDRTRLDLENTVQDLEASNEELSASNEELLSLNEEWQSANEELKTSKEEVQTGMEALSRARADLQNLLEGTQIATVYLDSTGAIKSFTPTVVDVYNVKAGDIGRPLSDITHKAVEMPPLADYASSDLIDEILEDEVQTVEGRWFLRRTLPYRRDDHSDGVILTFTDISERMQTTARLAVAHDVTQLLADADSFTDVAPAILEAVRSNLNIEFCALWLVEPRTDTLYCAEMAMGENIPQLQPFVAPTRELRLKQGEGLSGRVWETKAPHWSDNVGYDPEFHRADSARESGLVTGIAMPILSGKRFHGAIECFSSNSLTQEPSLLNMLSGIGHEIGQFIRRKRLDDRFRDEEARKTAILEASLDCIITMDIEGNIVDFNTAAERTFQLTHKEATGKPLAEVIIPEELRDAHRDGLQRFLKTGKSALVGQRVELEGQRADGSNFPIELAISVSSNRDGTPFFTGYLRDISDRNETEFKLADAKARLEFSMQVSGVAPWSWNMRTNEVVANPNLNRLFGFGPDENPALAAFLTRIDEADRQRVTEAIEAAVQNGAPYEQEYQVNWPSGETRWLRARGQSQKSGDGTIEDFFGVVSDVTDHKLYELELADREAHLRRVIDNMLGFVGVLDPDGTLLEANATALKSGDVQREDEIGKKFWDCYWWNYDATVAAQLQQAIQQAANGEIVRYDVTVRMAGDTRMLIDFMLVPVRDDQGELRYLIPSGIDITERKQTEQRLTMALKSGGMAAWEWTPEKSVWSNTLYDLLGITSTTPASPETLFEYVHEDDLAGLKTAWERATAGEIPYHHEFRIRRPDGEVRWLAGAGEIERNRAGGVLRIYGLNWDVTDQHRAVEALQESQQKAQQANIAKSEFLANMSHEIRTPMTAVLGYADILAATEQDAKRLEHLRTIKRNGTFLIEIINDILDLSKIEAGKLEVSTERFPLHQLLADVHSTMFVRAREKQIDFEVEYKGEIPAEIDSDSKRLRQILVNLAGNAIKFTEQGSVRIVVRYLAKESKPCIQFDVVDTGIGISEEQQQRLFRAFSQADSTVDRKYGGTGLGLAISQRLAQLLEGEIHVQSSPGVGSTFTCTIAAGNVEGVKLIEPSLDAVAQPFEPEQSNQRLSCRVLVVDDRRDVRFLTKRILADAGAEVSLAEDGLQALQMVEEANGNGDSWDLILLDMQMPRLDGYQAAARLRKMDFSNPIIALTADAMHGDMDLCIQSGCDAYLSKPIDAAKLVDIVAEYTQ